MLLAKIPTALGLLPDRPRDVNHGELLPDRHFLFFRDRYHLIHSFYSDFFDWKVTKNLTFLTFIQYDNKPGNRWATMVSGLNYFQQFNYAVCGAALRRLITALTF